MEAIIERCCGLDVHQETVVACLLVGPPGEQPHKEVRTSRTVTRDLEALLDWLKEAGVTHVGMESTGVYWRPVYAVLEGHFELIVGNARHIRNVPGCKTDVKDAEWIADLVRHGLIAKSFVPPQTAAGAARAAALPPQAGRKPDGRTQPAPEASGNHQHQAGERRFRRLRRVRPGDAPGADRGRGLARGDGRSRPGPASPKARRSDPRARRAGRGASPLPSDDAVAPARSDRGGHRGARPAQRRAARALSRATHAPDADPRGRLGGCGRADRRDRRRHERILERLSFVGLGGRLSRQP